MSGRGRGRGKASKTTEKTVELNETVNEIVEPVLKEKEKEIPVKRASKKKQFPVVAVITPDGIEGNLLQGTRRPLIVHLPIQSKNVQMNDMPIAYDPFPPTEAVPYDSNADNPFCEEVEQLTNTAQTVSFEPKTADNASSKKTTEQEPELDYYTLKSTLLLQFKESSELKKLPDHSDSACFWCCHSFTHRPVVLPIRDTGEYIQVTGNFCSPECATSYLFDMRQDSHTRWEQLSLLYRLYGDVCKGKIHPAPPRAVLSLFGGTLSIQEYRKLLHSQKVRVDIHLPPMVSILATMDTKPIDFYDSSLTKNVTETVKERLQKAEDVLRLRRTKPLKAWESTLDACLNFKIGGQNVSTDSMTC